MDKKEEERLKIFCNHPKWSVILQEITHLVGSYERLNGSLRDLDENNTVLVKSAFPLELGTFRLEVAYGTTASGRSYTVFAGEDRIYDFTYSSEVLQDEEPEAEEEPQPQGRHFFGVGPGAPTKALNFGIVTHVNAVDWKHVFGLEQFLRDIKAHVEELQLRLQEQQAEDQEALKNFDDFIEAAADLLQEELMKKIAER